ncbi:Potassium voltage-gated channel subfamily H member 7 [Ophiophagus hannah]|nr:Potassium voltage-gated channel subfamily H member 7 [Ophiophagus hannah]
MRSRKGEQEERARAEAGKAEEEASRPRRWRSCNMPVRRGHVAPQNTFLGTIIRKFEGQSKGWRRRGRKGPKTSLNSKRSGLARAFPGIPGWLSPIQDGDRGSFRLALTRGWQIVLFPSSAQTG